MDHTVDCNGITVHYEDHGTGAPIVLLHGGLVTARMMWGPHIEMFAAAHRVLAPDTRGHGRTDNPAGSLRYEQFADDTAAFIAALGLERPVVVGYSDGAQTALELALRHPDAAGAVALGGIVVEQDADYAAMLESLGMAVPGQVDVDRLRGTVGDFADAVIELHGDRWRALLEETSVLWHNVPEYSDETLATVSLPTLVLTGDADTAAFAQAHRIVQAVPGAELAVLPGADHGGAITRPLFTHVVLDFVERVAPTKVAED
ncbi:alpha/beta fold hydrolase [Pseudonocardia sp. TRM90224]|uniref:alpha/beta fold hydrolase n=1 Tax=Pseudonocardia sp. TRM90224 TaxID=2812678 RepID=UPI001E63D631|nr:alpha/beta hydrolase [Pseudonocardia sp. TRM90224]